MAVGELGACFGMAIIYPLEFLIYRTMSWSLTLVQYPGVFRYFVASTRRSHQNQVLHNVLTVPESEIRLDFGRTGRGESCFIHTGLANVMTCLYEKKKCICIYTSVKKKRYHS